jgi:hypothetical protein
MRLAFVALYGIFDHSRTALTGSALVLKVAKSRRKVLIVHLGVPSALSVG